MLDFIKNKILEIELDKIEKILRNADYTKIKHGLMKMKWEALRLEDNNTYKALEDYEKIVNVLEEVFGKENNICQ